MKRLFVIGKRGPAFTRDEQRADVTDYSRDAFDSMLSTACAVFLALAGAAALVLAVSFFEAWWTR